MVSSWRNQTESEIEPKEQEEPWRLRMKLKSERLDLMSDSCRQRGSWWLLISFISSVCCQELCYVSLRRTFLLLMFLPAGMRLQLVKAKVKPSTLLYSLLLHLHASHFKASIKTTESENVWSRSQTNPRYFLNSNNQSNAPRSTMTFFHSDPP